MPSTVANKLNRNLPPTLKTANVFRTNFAYTTRFSSVVTLEIHIWVNSPSLHKVLMRLLMYNNSQSMVPFSSSDHRLLLSASTFADCSHFSNVTIEDANVVPQSHDPLTPRYMTSQQISKIPPRLEDFRFATFSSQNHLIHTTTSEESLRVLFFTRSLAVDLVH